MPRYLLRILFLFCFLLTPGLFLDAKELNIQGSLSQRYRFQTTGSINDHDMETLFTFDYGKSPPKKISASLQAGAIFDLDADPANSPFASIYDTFDNRAAFRLYYAHADLHDTGPFELIKLGRQYFYEFESLYFDGLFLQTKPYKGFTLSSYVGVPVHLFENQLGFDPGDWLVGGALEWYYYTAIKARFDYVHLKDEVTGFRTAARDGSDDLLGVTVWLDPTDHVRLMSRFTSFSDQVRDVAANATFIWPKQDFTIRLNTYRLLKSYDIRVIDFDAFVGIAGTYRPFTEFTLNATKGLGPHFSLDGGFGMRILDNDQIASAFNHGYSRFFLSTATTDKPFKGMSLTATTDYYRGRDNALQNDNFGFSFDASQKLHQDRLKISAGTAYYLYRFNLFTGNESDDVQVYYVKATSKFLRNFQQSLTYEFENNDFNNFHQLDLKLTWSFK